MKRIIILVGMLLLLVGLGISLFLLTRPPSDVQTICTGCCDIPDPPPYILIDTNDPDDIVRIEKHVDGHSLVLERVDGVWVIAACDDYKQREIVQNIPQTMLNAAREIQATAILIENIDSDRLGEFGFDEPNHLIMLTDRDGNTKWYTFGALSSHARAYYFFWSGSDNLYIVREDLAWKMLDFFYVHTE